MHGAITQPEGLTTVEAEQQRAAGLGNDVEQPGARSVAGIIHANVLTRFNAIIAALTVVILVFGDPIDAVFGFVMVLNSAIGIIQELRAKRSLDAVRVLITPSIGVVRDGRTQRVGPEELVLGDVIRLEVGDQVPVDGEVLSSQGLEVDESSLTGESDPVPKPLDADVLSGSGVVAGGGLIRATAVGRDSWAYKLTEEAKEFVLTQSELRVGIDRLLKTIGWILPPLAALLLWSQLRTSANFSDGLVSAVAGVVGLVPQGLVLLVSLTFAIAVIRLARDQVVVQELPAVEGLARVDVLCVDKTGTLTTGRLAVESMEAITGTDDEFHIGLAALAQLDSARSSTMDALRPMLQGCDPGWSVMDAVSFSSVRKWSGATFEGQGSWILGAPEILLDAAGGEADTAAVREARKTVDRLAAQARRVLLVARSTCAFGVGEQLPEKLQPIGLVVLKEEVRSDAATTMEYFRQQNVTIKVLSGDNPQTVAAVAAELGIAGPEDYVDLRTVQSLEDVALNTTVFGRVLPEQKRDLVRILQDAGHTVAMTGDGVNDIPSLKAADIGIAMNTAMPATKAIAQLILLDGRFDRLPNVVAEGRRVVTNMERVSSLFVTKTVYAAVLAIVVGVAGFTFPFLPRHLSLINAVTIGVPAFILSFGTAIEPCRPGYLRRVLHFSIPAGLVAAAATLGVFWGARSSLIDANLEQSRTMATTALTLTGLWILGRLVRPLDWMKAGLIAVLAAAMIVALIPSWWSDFYELDLPPAEDTALLLAGLLAALGLVDMSLKMLDRYRNRHTPRAVPHGESV